MLNIPFLLRLVDRMMSDGTNSAAQRVEDREEMSGDVLSNNFEDFQTGSIQ